jgi:predicted MFS family arabinose efflux permease
MVTAAGVGGFLGSLTGSAIKARRPHLITFGMLAVSTVVTALCAVFFGLWAALVVALVAAFGQVLSKLALDSTVQHEIGEEVRSSAFAASETVNQLSWVAGGLAGLLMSLTSSGVAGLTVAAAGLAISFVLLVLHRRRRILTARRQGRRQAPRPAQ